MNTKTIFKMLAAAMLMPAMLLTTACSSDDDAVNDNANTQKKYYEIPVTVTVTRQGDEGTRAVYNETDKTLSFSEGDKLFVNGNHPTTGAFAGVLDLVSATDGTFEGTVFAENSYTGTAKSFLEQVDNHAFATLLPAGYENYEYLQYTVSPVDGIISPYTDVSAMIENSLLPLGKAEAVAQLSYEHAFNYNNSVFALSPVQPVICCTISGLSANTAVPVFYDGEVFDISGNITTDASGTATFAFADLAERTLGTLTVNDNDITLPSNVQLEAGKVYNINRSVAPAAPDPTVTLTPAQIGYLLSDGSSNTINGITIAVSGDAHFNDVHMDVQGEFDPAIHSEPDQVTGEGSFTFTSSVGKIKRIDINHETGRWSGAGDGWPASYDVYENGTFTWSGTPAYSVTLNGSQNWMNQCNIYYISSIVFTLEK